MHRMLWATICTGLLVTLTSGHALAQTAGTTNGAKPKVREFYFTYGATVTKLKPGEKAKVWIPVAPCNKHQYVAVVSRKFPGQAQLTKETTYGNETYYFEADADKDGNISFDVTYFVKRTEVKGSESAQGTPAQLIQRFLEPDAKVPIEGKPLTLLEGKKLPADDLKIGKSLFDIVNDHMTYSKQGVGWGQGDSVWACDSKYGNCTDFHSLFISLARAQKIPSKFVMGFGVPEKRGQGPVGGYHCWAWFMPKGQGWVPVDISQSNQVKKDNPTLAGYLFGNLTEDRVVFTTGRDLNLTPKQAGGPLNFLIYPYVEAGGMVVPQADIQKRFAYEDVQG